MGIQSVQVVNMKRGSITFRFVSLLALLLVAQSVVPIGGAVETEIISEQIEEIQRLVTEGDIPSLHACVVSGNENVWVRGFGDQTSHDTVFLIGSVQKVFVAISILQLYEDGSIGLDDDVNDYLPFTLEHPDFPNSPVTIRILLSHRSGLIATLPSEFCFDWEGPDCERAVIGIPLGEYLSKCLPSNGSLYRSSNWLFEPGTQYSYSNNGYKVLMYILETVSNQTISEYMKENIFGPLRMNNTGFNASEFMGHHATPHTRTYGNATNKELPIWNGQYMLRSTVSDMGHLLIALMNEGQFDGYQLLQQDTVALMFENTCPSIIKSLRGGIRTREVISVGYGLGIGVFGNEILGHGGSTVGFTAECYFNPNTRLGYVRLSNVNAILDYTSTEWQDVNRVTDKIHTLVMTEIGMLPTIDLYFIVIVIITLGSIIALFRTWHSRRK